MSGGLSYSGIVGYGKVTLPSVESWGTNMNILRDPPKGVYTRRKDKVGQTSLITDMIDASGDRACEAIQVYARGRNPMVNVEYGQNSGGNAGLAGSLVPTLTAAGNPKAQATLPYKLSDVFRPPVLRQENLLPLSRLPRVWTSAFTSKDFPNFSKKMRSCPPTAKELRSVKDTTLRVCTRPTEVFRIEKPLVEPFEVKYVIQNPIRVSAHSGIRTIDKTLQTVDEPVKPILEEPLHLQVQAMKTLNKHVNNVEFNTDKYIQEGTYKAVNSKMSLDYGTPIGDIADMELQRKIPEHQARTNQSQNIHKSVVQSHVQQLGRNHPIAQAYVNRGSVTFRRENDNSSREYHLAPKIELGGFEGKPVMRHNDRVSNMTDNIISEKASLGKKAMAQFHERYMNNSNPYQS